MVFVSPIPVQPLNTRRRYTRKFQPDFVALQEGRRYPVALYRAKPIIGCVICKCVGWYVGVVNS